MKKSIAILLTLVAIQSNCFGQRSLTDSLRSKLSLTQEDTTKALLYSKLAEAYVFSDPDSAFYYGSEGLQLARAIKFSRGDAWNMFWLSVYFRFTGDPSQAMLFASKALNTFNELNDKEGAIYCTQMLAWTAQDQDDYIRALQFSLRTQRLSEQHHNFRLYYAYATIAQIYRAVNKLDSGLLFANKALEVQDEDNIWPTIVLADLHQQLDRDSLALHYYHTAIRMGGSSPRLGGITLAQAYIGIASLFYKMQYMDSAVYYARKAFSIAEENNFMRLISASSDQLASIYDVKRSPDSVVKYLQISAAMKDSLFSQEKTRQFQSLVFSEKLQQQEMEAAEHEYQNRVRIYVLLAIVAFFLVIAVILYRNNSLKQKVNVQLQNQKEEIETTLEHLTATQNQLIRREKMASLGELTAGIAHEIQNPLNFVNNFSEVNKELLVEMKEEIEKGNFDEVKSIAGNLIDNQEKINHHGKRADSIVKGMLQHSRSSNVAKEPSNINTIVDEYFRLAYHGLRAKDKSFNAKVSTSYDETIENINIVRQDIGTVILNLVNNAFYAVREKSRLASHEYQPEVEIKTKKAGSFIEISVRDNGNGIPSGIVDKIFQPFFTTKPTGQGTGLGLSLSYDIVKAHGGELKVETMQGKGAEFTFSLPSNKAI